MMDKPKLVVIIGPTGSGKTALGLAAARMLEGAVVSADSRQVYAGMNVGTATPQFKHQESLQYGGMTKDGGIHDYLTANLVEDVEHYLFDVRWPDDQLSLVEWQVMAFDVIDMLIENRRTPLLVGGTMLYVDSVVLNYDIPNVDMDPIFRDEIKFWSTAALWKMLLRDDPLAESYIQAKNRRRIIRALEVMRATGRPFSDQRVQRAPKYDVRMVGLFPKVISGQIAEEGWELLRERIELRTVAMLQDGLHDETKELMRVYGSDLPLLKTLNYRQAKAMIVGKMTQEEAIADMVRTSMRYARRQMSWWRRREDVRWFDEENAALRYLEATT